MIRRPRASRYARISGSSGTRGAYRRAPIEREGPGNQSFLLAGVARPASLHRVRGDHGSCGPGESRRRQGGSRPFFQHKEAVALVERESGQRRHELESPEAGGPCRPLAFLEQPAREAAPGPVGMDEEGADAGRLGFRIEADRPTGPRTDPRRRASDAGSSLRRPPASAPPRRRNTCRPRSNEYPHRRDE